MGLRNTLAPVYRVVVADDVTDLRFVLKAALERTKRFMVVGEAANGKQAVAAAIEHRPDLALLDRSMPIMDGLEALPKIRAAVPESTVVVLSGFETSAMSDQALAAGAAAYLVKGLSPRELTDQLLELLEREKTAAAAEADPVALPGMTLRLPADLSSVRQARRFVQRTLRDWSRRQIEDEAMLLTSELVTNAVVHARSEVHLTLLPLEDRVRIEVADSGDGALQMVAPDPDSLSGRGLLLVQELARMWGTSADGSRKVVWFEI